MRLHENNSDKLAAGNFCPEVWTCPAGCQTNEPALGTTPEAGSLCAERPDDQPDTLLVRATLRIHNQDMIAARKRLGLTIARLVKQRGLCLKCFYWLQSFQFDKVSLAQAEKIATALELPLDKVMPESCAKRDLSVKAEKVFEASPGAMTALAENARRRLTVASPAELAEKADQTDFFRKAVGDLLPARHAEVVTRHYGLDGDGPETFADIARDMGFSMERARQIELRSLRILRKRLPDGLKPDSLCAGRPA